MLLVYIISLLNGRVLPCPLTLDSIKLLKTAKLQMDDWGSLLNKILEDFVINSNFVRRGNEKNRKFQIHKTCIKKIYLLE